MREIRLGSFATAAATAGAVVIIDVVRAFTTAAVALERGAEAVVMAASQEEALDLRAAGVGSHCMGERGGLKPAGFDFGNSPLELAGADLTSATLIQTTSNGTRGILAAAEAGANPIYAGAFVTAEATVRALQAVPVDRPITLVAMGQGDRERAEEDELCALYLRGRLEGRQPDGAAIAAVLRSLIGAGDGRHFESLNRADIEACLALDRHDFAVRVVSEGDRLVARKG